MLSIMCMVAMLFMGFRAPVVMADTDAPTNATVSFGAWQTDPPLDRFPPALSNDRLRNEHQLIPGKAKIKPGGSVNFIVSGFHNVIVYDDGTQPEDIKPDANPNAVTTGPTPAPPVRVIDDPTHRIYRGQDPSLQPLERASSLKPTPEFLQDRVEAVFFPKPGTYLVICGIRDHFVNDGMFGFVEVAEKDDD
jgi:plastocyanin